MECKECGIELLEQDASSYIRFNHFDMIDDYVSVLCQKCLKARKQKIGIV